MKLISLSLLLFLFTACSSVRVQEYAQEKPTLVLEEYLNGTLDAHGFFENRSGQVVKRFYVLMKGTWKGSTGTLEEAFTYSDGTKSRRVWTIQKNPDGTYTGTAADVIGKATGQAAGNALQWKYTLDLPVGKKSYHVQLDDWMYLMNDKIMLNKSVMSKFGFKVGEITITFIKRKP